jgi:sec-independent protein translocase protein TatA
MGLPNIGPLELIIILAIALLIVGPRRLPEMGNAVGRTIREFRKASSDISDATSVKPDAKPASRPEPEAATSASGASAPTVQGLAADATEDAAPRT